MRNRVILCPQLATINGEARRLIRNTDFKTAATSTLDVAVPVRTWLRLLEHVDVERPVLLVDQACDKVIELCIIIVVIVSDWDGENCCAHNICNVSPSLTTR